jgi:hypothetical protein
MEIKLKNIKINDSFSEETTCFTADIYADGKKVGTAKNDGHGGDTWCRPLYSEDDNVNHAQRKLFELVEIYCKTLPDRTVQLHEDREPFTYSMNLETVVDDLLAEHLDEKFKKKMVKDMEKGVIYGDSQRYHMIYWKGTTISALLENPTGKARIMKVIEDIESLGQTILNTNIPR